MSLDFLASIEQSLFPLVVRKPRDVDNVRVLKAAELITASIPYGPLNRGIGDDAEAVVFGLTERGELALRQRRLPESPIRRGRRPLDDD